jgi:hypothetical protein
MGKQDSITQIEEKVREGLRIARESVNDKALLKLCDDLEYTWQYLCANLLIVSVGLSAMRYRTREQIGEQLRQYMESIKSAKDQRARMFITDMDVVH